MHLRYDLGMLHLEMGNGLALQRKVPRESLSRVASFDAMGSMMFKPIGLAIAAPMSALVGI